MYPSIAKRIKASVFDSVAVMTVIALLMTVYLYIGVETPFLVLLVVLIALLYEPVLVSWKGMTLGHRVCNFRVIDVRTTKKLSFVKAIARFLIKSFLGIVSLFWIFFTNRQQAFHDMATGSIVINSDVSHDVIETIGLSDIPLSPAGDTDIHVSIFRRVAASLIWSAIIYISLSIICVLVVPAECLDGDTGGNGYCELVEAVLGCSLVGILFVCFFLGSKGKLLGARSKKRVDA